MAAATEEREAVRTGLRGNAAMSDNAIRDAIAKQPKMKIKIPVPSYVKKGTFYREQVMINGYSFQIPCGEWCMVPEEVYLILVRSGKVQPIREEDDKEVPEIITQSGAEYNNQTGPGSASNPIQIG